MMNANTTFRKGGRREKREERKEERWMFARKGQISPEMGKFCWRQTSYAGDVPINLMLNLIPMYLFHKHYIQEPPD